MRLWTLHPRYLDPQGLVAAWREALLAQKVLAGLTRGYRHHPQLARFRAHRNPPAAIATFLAALADEADARGYRFDRSKIGAARVRTPLREARGQLLHEWDHLLAKLRRRSPAGFERWRGTVQPKPHPLFRLIPGPVAPWEKAPPVRR